MYRLGSMEKWCRGGGRRNERFEVGVRNNVKEIIIREGGCCPENVFVKVGRRMFPKRGNGSIIESDYQEEVPSFGRRCSNNIKIIVDVSIVSHD